jgi:hypothetical protein
MFIFVSVVDRLKAGDAISEEFLISECLQV